MSSLRGEERTEFSQKVRKLTFARACRECSVDGVENIPGVPQCETCGKEVRPGGYIYEHDLADGLGGEPTAKNCKLNCLGCKVSKDKTDNKIMSKADRVLKKSFGLMPEKRSTIKSAGFQKAAPQRTASTPVQKWRGF